MVQLTIMQKQLETRVCHLPPSPATRCGLSLATSPATCLSLATLPVTCCGLSLATCCGLSLATSPVTCCGLSLATLPVTHCGLSLATLPVTHCGLSQRLSHVAVRTVTCLLQLSLAVSQSQDQGCQQCQAAEKLFKLSKFPRCLHREEGGCWAGSER